MRSLRALIAATSFKSSDYVAMVGEVRPEVPTLTDVVFIGTPDWEELRSRAVDVTAEQLAQRQAGLANTDPINKVVDNIRLTIMAVIAGYATLCLTIGLLRYTSGEPGEVERGKAGIRNAIIGYVGAALSPVIVTIIAGWVA